MEGKGLGSKDVEYHKLTYHFLYEILSIPEVAR